MKTCFTLLVLVLFTHTLFGQSEKSSIGGKENPSSFYSSLSYARGLTRDYKKQNTAIAEADFRWMVYKGFNVRIGAAALAAEGKDVKINPTPGITYSFFFK